MKYGFLLTLFYCFFGSLKAQDSGDFIITWKNDTIACSFPNNPKDADIRPARRYLNGHINIPTIFENDSVRIIRAGDIKAYSRNKHGKSLLCDGYFESKKLAILDNVRKNPGGDTNEEWYFLRRLVDGKYASLHIIYLGSGDNMSSFLFLTIHNSTTPDMIKVWGWKKTLALLSDSNTAEEVSKSKRNGSNKYSDLVKEYNRLKEEVAILQSGSNN